MRIVYLSHVAQPSGAEIGLVRLIAAAPAIEAIVILAEDGPLVDRLETVGAQVEVLPLSESARRLPRSAMLGAAPLRAVPATFAYAGRLAERLGVLRPDLVHTVSLKAALYGSTAARLARRPVLWHLHDRLAADYLPAPAVPVLRLLAGSLPTAIAAPSRYSLATTGSLHRPGLIRAVLPFPVPTPARAHELRDPVRRIGIVGRLTPWKGQHVFLDAFARAFPDGPVQGAVIGSAMFGEHDYADELRGQAERLGIAGRIDFTGFRSDMDAELASLDILVHASVLADPLTTVVIEGMAAGMPVISADAGGHAEHVEDGVHGLKFPPGDAAALARQMRRLADDPGLRERISHGGAQLARRFSPEVVVDETLALYRRILDRSSPRR